MLPFLSARLQSKFCGIISDALCIISDLKIFVEKRQCFGCMASDFFSTYCFSFIFFNLLFFLHFLKNLLFSFASEFFLST